jgi:excisionase family DNA binding protein
MINACSIPEACLRLGISRTTLYHLIRDGGLPARKLGKRTVVLNADIDAFLTALPTLK